MSGPAAAPPAGEPPSRFVVRCAVEPSRADELAPRRARHLRHVLDHRDRIVFGGVVGEPHAPPRELLFVLAVADRDDAVAFAQADPYAPLYASVDVDAFTQHLPELRPGALAARLEQAGGAAAAGAGHDG